MRTGRRKGGKKREGSEIVRKEGREEDSRETIQDGGRMEVKSWKEDS